MCFNFFLCSLVGIPVGIATSAIIIKVLSSEPLIDSNFSNDEFVSVNNLLKEYDDMKEEIKNSNNK